MNIKLNDNELSTLVGGDAPLGILVITGKSYDFGGYGFLVTPGEGITEVYRGDIGSPGVEIIR